MITGDEYSSPFNICPHSKHPWNHDLAK